MATFHERYDLLLTATTAHPPPAIGELGLKSYERVGLRMMQAAPVKAVLLKVPPLASGPSGLPIGLQFSAPFGDEGTLLRLAAQLEQARPWVGRKPRIHA